MSAPAVSRRAERRLALPDVTPAWGAAAALVLLAIGIRVAFGTVADVAWMVECNERWLDGAVPYRDFSEVNPPASLMLYWPAVAVARALGVGSDGAVIAFGFVLGGAALLLSAFALRRAASLSASVPLAAVVALLALPGQSFCERDHLAAVLGLPFLAVALARAERAPVGGLVALLAGLGAGAMAAIKPPYALIGIAIGLYLLRRIGWRAALKGLEFWAAAALGLAYIAILGPLFPDYVRDALPVGVDVYVPLRESFATLLASPGLMVSLLIVAAAALTAGERIASPGFAISLIASLAAGVAYFVQGKGWVYQAVPAMMFATLAGGFAVADRDRRTMTTLAVGALVAGAAVPLAHSLGLGLVLGAVAGFALEAALSRDPKMDTARLAPFALAAAVGAACGLCVIERPLTPALEKQLAALGPHLTIGTISEDMGLGFPLARRIGAVWALRTHSLYVNDGVARRLSERPGDAALAARLNPYAARETNELIEDISARRPDALLVGPVKTKLHADLFADERIQAQMENYRRIGVEQKPGYSAELWLRRDRAN